MRIRSWLVTGLVGLNLALATVLVVRSLNANRAYAQPRGRTDFVSVSGHLNNNMVFYIFDTNSGRLAALRTDGKLPVAAAATANVNEDMARAFPR